MFGWVVCLAGINEAGRELENPFRNVPNELPVVTLMAEFNKSLISGKTATSDGDWDTSTESNLDKEQTPAPANKEQPQIIIPTEQQQSQKNMSPHKQQQAEVDRLRAIVAQQGMIMGKMLEEQTGLNQMIQAAFSKK